MLSMCRSQFVLRQPTKHFLVLAQVQELVPARPVPALVPWLALRPRHCHRPAGPSRRPVVRLSVLPNFHLGFVQSDPSCCPSFLVFPRRQPLPVQALEPVEELKLPVLQHWHQT